MTDLSKLPATLFSPFKTLYIGYIILIALDKISISGFCEFFGISMLIMTFEIIHNDFLRKMLNNKADNL